MSLDMVGFMIDWFSAEVTHDGEVLFSTDSRNALIAWANAHHEHASASYYAIYCMQDNGHEQESAGPVSDLIDWPEPPEVEPDWETLEANAYGAIYGRSTPIVDVDVLF